jgi:hypothetical protein
MGGSRQQRRWWPSSWPKRMQTRPKINILAALGVLDSSHDRNLARRQRGDYLRLGRRRVVAVILHSSSLISEYTHFVQVVARQVLRRRTVFPGRSSCVACVIGALPRYSLRTGLIACRMLTLAEHVGLYPEGRARGRDAAIRDSTSAWLLRASPWLV